MRNQVILLDTFQDFSDYWSYARSMPSGQQISMWQTTYMDKYPELLEKQIQCYKAEHANWEYIASHIFPTFSMRLPVMEKARSNVLCLYKSTCSHASEKLGLDLNIILVVYVGIGCGAGWATRYNGKPAILLGLENIAEEKWHTRYKLRGLISHEIGHLAHMYWSDEPESFGRNEEDPLFQLYSEGFAQKCEQLVTGKATWHIAPNQEWFSWCKQNRRWLAREFLERLKANIPVKDFFGSWFDIHGIRQTGYFLGNAFISELEKTYSLREIASLKTADMKNMALDFLDSLSVQPRKSC